MKRLVCVLCMIHLFAATCMAGDAPGNPILEVNRPNLDAYRLVSLTLAGENLPVVGRSDAAAIPPTHLYLGHIDGQLIQFWSTAQTLASVKVETPPDALPNMDRFDPLLMQLRERDASKLAIGADAIRGSIRFGLRPGGGRLTGWVVFTIDAKVTGATVAGTYSWKVTKAAKDHADTGEVVIDFSGTLAGTVATAKELAKANAIAQGQEYLNWRGDGSGCAPKGGVALTGDAGKVQMRWVSEDDMAGSWGFTGLYFGGYAQPLLTGNRIYVAYYRPSVAKDATPMKPGRTFDCSPSDMSKYYVNEADEVMVCLDAATGVTLWKRAFLKDGFNLADRAKYGPWIPPCIDDGRWFVEGTSGSVYCLDIATGQVLWRSPPVGAGGNAATVALQAGDGVVVTTSGIGLDAKTGEKVWGPSRFLSGGSRGNGTVGRLKWVHEGVTYFVTRDGCVRARDGKECWEVPYPEPGPDPTIPGRKLKIYKSPWPVLQGDRLVVPVRCAVNDPNDKNHVLPVPTTCYRMYPDRVEKLWELPESELPLGLDHAPVIVGGHVYFMTFAMKSGATGGAKTEGRLASIDMANGKIVSMSPVAFDVNSNFSNLFAQDGVGYIGGRGGRLLKLRPDGSIDMWTATQKGEPIIALMAGHMDGYLFPVLLDGRLFRRTLNGYMACYDLREKQNK